MQRNTFDLGAIQKDGVMWIAPEVITHVWNIPVEAVILIIHTGAVEVYNYQNTLFVAEWDCFAIWGDPVYYQWS